MTSFIPTSDNIPYFWPKLEFSLFLIGQTLSIPCYLFIFYHILFDKTARQSLHNHSILILLFYNFLSVLIDLSLTQGFHRLGYVATFYPALCLIWQFIDFGIWYGGISIMLWLSIERHILIFHPNLVRTTRRRLLFHYIPLLISSLYTPMLYFYLIFLLPCNRTYINTHNQCGSPCFYEVVPTWFNLYDSLINYTFPILLIVVFSFTLFLRFSKQRQRLQQAVTWRQSRKMLIQLCMVSATYLLFDLPYVIIFIVREIGFPTFGDNILSPYIMRLTYVPGIIVPFATLIGLPGLKQKVHSLFIWKRNVRITPLSCQNH